MLGQIGARTRKWYKLKNLPGFRKYQTPLKRLPKGVENGSRCARVDRLADDGSIDSGVCIIRANPARTGPMLTAITWGLWITREELEAKTGGFKEHCDLYVFIGIGTKFAGVGNALELVDLFERRL